MDLARAGATAPRPDGLGHFLTNGARHRARVIVTIPFHRLVPDRPDCLPTTTSRPNPTAAPSGPDPTGAPSQPDPTGGPARGGFPVTSGDPADCAGAWSCNNGPGEGFLSENELLRLSCDAEVQRLILGPKSQPLDIGRSTRVVPDHVRTALTKRDGGCVMPGYRRPPGWCEAHHIKHWSDGGETSVQNLALLCSRHHHELHNGTWRVTMTDGIPQARRRRE